MATQAAACKCLNLTVRFSSTEYFCLSTSLQPCRDDVSEALYAPRNPLVPIRPISCNFQGTQYIVRIFGDSLTDAPHPQPDTLNSPPPKTGYPNECPILAAPQQFALNPKPQIAAGWGIGQSPTPLPHNPYNLQSTTTTQ